MLHMKLQYRLYIEMLHSLWANYMDTFRGYWLHGRFLRKISDGKIILNVHVWRLACILPDSLSDAAHHHHNS
jgi:hypothetical protein